MLCVFQVTTGVQQACEQFSQFEAKKVDGSGMEWNKKKKDL